MKGKQTQTRGPMQTLKNGWRIIQCLMNEAGPYVLLEILLPGGPLLALILLIYRSGALTALQPMPVIRQQVSQTRALLERPADTVQHRRISPVSPSFGFGMA